MNSRLPENHLRVLIILTGGLDISNKLVLAWAALLEAPLELGNQMLHAGTLGRNDSADLLDRRRWAEIDRKSGV